MEAQEGVRGLFCKQLFLAACFLDLWIPRIPLIQADRIKIVLIPANPTEGQDLTFSVENVQGDIREFIWFRGATFEDSMKIFSFFPGQYNPQKNGAQYTNREKGFHNGSLQITGIERRDVGKYSTLLHLRPQEDLRASIDLRLPGLMPAAPVTTIPLTYGQPWGPPPTNGPPRGPTKTPPTNKPPWGPTKTPPTNGPLQGSTKTPPTNGPIQGPSVVGWIVAGVAAGLLLFGIIGAILLYRFVLRKKETGRRVAETPDSRRENLPAHQNDDQEPFYEVVGSSAELPKNFLLISGPLPPLPGTCPKLDSNYMDLLHKTESVYTEMKR